MPEIEHGDKALPRNGGGVYSLPNTYEAVSGETIEAQQHNDPLEDLQQDANTARPIVAGGTGETTAAAAATALGVGAASNVTHGGLTLVSPDAGATAGPVLNLYRNSASPAAADIAGKIIFQGEDSAGNTEDYAEIYQVIDDPTSASEDASLLFRVKVAGTMTTRMSLAADGLVLPQGSAPAPTVEGAMQWETDVDRLVVGNGSGQAIFGQVTPWVEYTPLITGAGTVTGVKCFSRRIGDSLEMRGTFTSGTVSGTNVLVQLGFNGSAGNVTIDTAKVPATDPAIVGLMGTKGTSTPSMLQMFISAGDGTGGLYVSFQDGSTAGLTVRAGTSMLTSSRLYSFEATGVPISGWG